MVTWSVILLIAVLFVLIVGVVLVVILEANGQ